VAEVVAAEAVAAVTQAATVMVMETV